ETVMGKGQEWKDFSLLSQKTEPVSDGFGKGRRLTLTGGVEPLRKTVSVTIYDNAPGIAVFDVEYANTAPRALEVRGWTNAAYRLEAAPGVEPAFWSYQSGSYEKRPDWVLPLRSGFHQENYLGMNASDYGGGTPVVDVWRK